MGKYLNKTQTAEKLKKSMYKMVQKAIHDKVAAKDIVEDVIDDNYRAEADTKNIPAKRTAVMQKKDKKEKSVDKLKKYMKKGHKEEKKGGKLKKFLGLGGTKTSAQNPDSGIKQGKPAKPAEGQSIADQIGF